MTCLTCVPQNIHHVVNCRLFSELVSVVNRDVSVIGTELQTQLEEAIRAWEQSRPRVRSKPTLDMNHWLIKARRMQVLSSFPRLGTLGATKDLAFKGSEDRSSSKRWVKNCAKPSPPYEMKMTGSPYETHIHAICDPRDCPKIAAINRLIDREWEAGEKAVFTTMGPTNALILYWVSQYRRSNKQKRVINCVLAVPSSR